MLEVGYDMLFTLTDHTDHTDTDKYLILDERFKLFPFLLCKWHGVGH